MSTEKLYTLAQAFSLPLPREYTSALKLAPETSVQDVLEAYAKLKATQQPPSVAPSQLTPTEEDEFYKNRVAKLFSGFQPDDDTGSVPPTSVS